MCVSFVFEDEQRAANAKIYKEMENSTMMDFDK